jgi:hypothetical protein
MVLTLNFLLLVEQVAVLVVQMEHLLQMLGNRAVQVAVTEVGVQQLQQMVIKVVIHP